MSSRHLAVLLYGRHVAALEQTPGGQRRMHYRDDPGATPVSLTMPLAGGPFNHRVVDPFLEGLLPEREAAREAMSRELDVSARNPFALLALMGLDCAGAVQFCSEDEVPDVLARRGSLEALDDSDIEARLSELRTNPGASWLAPRERWSLAGAQAKFALRREADTWFEATGAEPTTHIIKPGVDGFRSQALNEHVCLQTARRAGLSAADSRFERFGAETALVVERYDRRRDSNGDLVRLHQEDLCQATSTFPRDKYESDGGPRAVTVVDLLRAASTRRVRQANLDAFVDALAFNVLVQAPDAHAKNYSVVLLDNIVRLAPLYDVASGAPYDSTSQVGLRRSAMAIGGRRDFADIDLERWRRFAREAGLDADAVEARVRSLAERIPDAMSDAFTAEAERSDSPEIGELRERMLDRIARGVHRYR
ncbi:type II toxin-antitoxin system HipA family toxin [Isoptericola sp. NPDC019482]|uniref:type II toxin-antitoxin system HipA family toxin n=1 Tax=Isoptericola sp. NPDC019482 TaxID=3154688 RepID=UPI003471FF42